MLKLSRASIIEALTIVENWSHTDINRLLLQFSLEDVAPAGNASRRDRANTLVRYLQQNSEEVGPSGNPLAFEIVEYVVISKLNSAYSWGDTPIEEQIPKLAALLKRDGYSVTQDGIYPIDNTQTHANHENHVAQNSSNQEQDIGVEPKINVSPSKHGYSSDEVRNLRSLIDHHKRRLHKLREQEALQGLSVDPKIAIEIEDIEAKIAKLKAELEDLEAGNL